VVGFVRSNTFVHSTEKEGIKMKLILSGYGNSGMYMNAHKQVMQQKSFRYVTVKVHGRQPGRYGAGFNYKFYGTNSLKELSDPKNFKDASQIIDTKTDTEMKKEDIAKYFLKSLTVKQKTALIDEILIQYLMKD
jgi:hypothetical protein